MKGHYSLTVYDKPRPWHRAGAGRSANGKPRFFKKREDVEAQFLIKAFWLTEYPEVKMLEGPLRLEVSAFLPYPKGRSKKSRLTRPYPVIWPDYDNLGKQVADALQGVAFADDKQIVTATIRKRFALSEEGQNESPRWEIVLEEL